MEKFKNKLENFLNKLERKISKCLLKLHPIIFSIALLFLVIIMMFLPFITGLYPYFQWLDGSIIFNDYINFILITILFIDLGLVVSAYITKKLRKIMHIKMRFHEIYNKINR